MTIPLDRDALVAGTIENGDYLIPDGEYALEQTWSPRFQKLMPEIKDVPDREGIRIHTGSKPEHSTGCVLLSTTAQSYLVAFLNYNSKYKENEKVTILIRTEFGKA